MFIIPCYVKVDDNMPIVIKELEELGYKSIINNPNHGSIVALGDGEYHNDDGYITIPKGAKFDDSTRDDIINCGNNVRLFLDLAAVNGEHDNKQLFLYRHKDGSLKFTRCTTDDANNDPVLKGLPFRKAELQEIIDNNGK